MKNKTTLITRTAKVGLGIGAIIIGSLAAPSVWADDAHMRVTVPVPSVNVQVGTPDDYVYYPKYGTYYSPKRHNYYYQDRGSWGWRNSPPGVARDEFLRAPSVKMDFHDSPERHHSEIVQKYPKNWYPRHDQHPDRHDDRKDR